MFNQIGCNVLVDVRADGTSLIGSEEIQNPLKPVMTVSTGMRIKPESEAYQVLLCPDPACAEKWQHSPQISLLYIWSPLTHVRARKVTAAADLIRGAFRSLQAVQATRLRC